MEEVFLGSPVEAKFRGTTFRTGVVTNIRNDGTADITYEDVSLPSQNWVRYLDLNDELFSPPDLQGLTEYRVLPSNIRLPQGDPDKFSSAGEATGRKIVDCTLPFIIFMIFWMLSRSIGKALRKTGKKIATFGDKVLKHLMAGEEHPAERARGTVRSITQTQSFNFLFLSLLSLHSPSALDKFLQAAARSSA